MAKAEAEYSDDDEDIVPHFVEFCKLAGQKDGKHMTSVACKKVVTDCLGKYNKDNVKELADGSVFPRCKDKGKPDLIIRVHFRSRQVIPFYEDFPPYMEKLPAPCGRVTTTSCNKLVRELAHDIVKVRKKDRKIDKKHPEVKALKAEMCACIKEKKGPVVKSTKMSKTGGVDKMTDTSTYTGSHKERFGADGKGKGMEGRKDKVDNSGYVGNYKDRDTYDKKH